MVGQDGHNIYGSGSKGTICNFRTLSSRLHSKANDQYSQLKWFILREGTEWSNVNPAPSPTL